MSTKTDEAKANVAKALTEFQNEVDAFWRPIDKIDRIPVPEPLVFFRDYVSRNVPVILESAIDHWPALDKWQDPQYLIKTTQDKKVRIEWTPNGLADSICCFDNQQVFAQPEQREMHLSDFFHHLYHPSTLGVPYLSQQNDNVRRHFSVLLDDIDPQLELAVQAFGNSPEAVNLWIGDERSVSSLHKDHYEVGMDS